MWLHQQYNAKQTLLRNLFSETPGCSCSRTILIQFRLLIVEVIPVAFGDKITDTSEGWARIAVEGWAAGEASV
jgi:hypothetical protein